MSWSSWDEFEEKTKGETGDASGGYVGQIVVEYGYKVFASGHNDSTSFFAAGDDKETALNAAKEFAAQVGAGKPTNGFLVKVLKESVLNRDVSNWQKDFTKFYAMFTDAVKKQIKPKMIEIGVLPNEVFWGQVSFVPDEYRVAQGEAGKTDTDQDGNPRYPTVMLPVRKFANHDESVEFVGKDETYTAQSNPGSTSDGAHKWAKETLANWDDAQIGENLSDILAAMQSVYDATNGPDTLKLNKSCIQVSEEWGISKDDLKHIWNEKPF